MSVEVPEEEKVPDFDSLWGCVSVRGGGGVSACSDP